MRLIVLNLWAGKALEPLKSFVKENAKETDIFCFQEMLFGNSKNLVGVENEYELNKIIEEILTDFTHHFVIMQDYRSEKGEILSSFGISTFVRKTINVEKSGSFFSHKERNDYFPPDDPSVMPSGVQYVTFSRGDKRYTIANFHGVAMWPKVDTPVRIKQSENISNFLKTINHSKILCGDFNLSPETESLKILAEDMRNLMKDNNILGTRSSLVELKDDTVSDYILVSPDITAKKLVVPDVAVSDHLPLIFDFE